MSAMRKLRRSVCEQRQDPIWIRKFTLDAATRTVGLSAQRTLVHAAAKVGCPPLVSNAALANGVRKRPLCMYRLLFAIDILARSRKSLICIRPVDRHAGRGHIGVTLAPWSH
jgi:hypothetical protein